jgi:hypothetical protein
MRVIAVSVAIVIFAGVLLDALAPASSQRRAVCAGHGRRRRRLARRPEREDEEAPSKALDALALKPGMVVAEIGAGSGYYSARIAKAVGPSAASTPPIFSRHDRVAGSAHQVRGLTNVTTVLGGWTIRSCRRSRSTSRSWWTSITSCRQPQIFLQRLKDAFKPAAAGAARVPQGRSEGADPRGAQDERGRSEAGDGSGGLCLDRVIEVAALAAHHRMKVK